MNLKRALFTILCILALAPLLTSFASESVESQLVVNIANGDVAALRAAINNANNTNNEAVVINLASGGFYNFTNTIATSGLPNHALPVFLHTVGITINGNGATLNIANGQTARFILNAIRQGTPARLELRNIVLQNGKLTDASHLGGAISNLGFLTLVNVSFRQNQAYACGAVHNHTTATLNIMGGHYYRNTATREGGALCTFGYTTIRGTRTITGSSPLEDTFDTIFQENTAPAGGAILGYIQQTSITRAKFLNNHAYYVPGIGGSGLGGAMGLDGGTYRINEVLVVGNTAERNVGGVYITNANATISDSWFYNNRAGYNQGGTITFADSAGGGLFNDAATTTVYHTSFFNNQSRLFGGGITNSGTLTLEDALLDGNSGAYGGAVANINQGNLTMRSGPQNRSVIRNTNFNGYSGNRTAIATFHTLNVTGTSILNNTPLNESTWGLIVMQSNTGPITFQNNCIVNTGGVWNVSPVTVNATSNWWGAANGPSSVGGSGERVQGAVNVLPFLTSQGIACASYGQAPADINLLVNPDFSSGLNNWSVFSESSSASGGVLQMGTGSALQSARYTAPASSPLQLRVQLSNPGGAPANVRLLLHDRAWGEQVACSFTLPANTGLVEYRLQTRTRNAWSSIDAHLYSDTGTIRANHFDLRYLPNRAFNGTQCTSLMGNMLVNAQFSAGLTGWGTFGSPTQSAIQYRINNGMFEFYRQAGSQSAVVLQDTGYVLSANIQLEARIDLGNSSGVRKRVVLLLHDVDFSDLQVCSFWLPPYTAPRTYTMRARTTEVWTSANLSLYASNADGQGWIQVDNVLFRYNPNQAINQVHCVDPDAPAPPGGGDSANLISNGNFSSAIGNPNGNWGTFGQISWRLPAGIFEFYRIAGTPAGVVFQNTNDVVGADVPVEAQFQLANGTGMRQRVTVLLHDNDFSDLQVCTFWLQPWQAMGTFYMRTHTTEGWTNATLSVYPSVISPSGYLQLDNVLFRIRPSASTVGTMCYEPGAVPADEMTTESPAMPTLEPTATAALGEEIPLIVTATPSPLEEQSGEGGISE